MSRDEAAVRGAQARAGRRVITLSLLRSASVVTALVLVYYLAPLDRPLNTATAFRFVLGLLGLGVVFVWQVRGVLASQAPWLRAANIAAIGFPLLIVLFASNYIVISNNVPNAFTEPLSHTDGLYFTVTVFATVGFGDIAPRAEIARIIVMIQMVVGIIAVGVVAKILFGAARMSVERRGPAPQPPDNRQPGAEDDL
jgi:voltage-gated potassium channel